MAMGFQPVHCVLALIQAAGSVERAAIRLCRTTVSTGGRAATIEQQLSMLQMAVGPDDMLSAVRIVRRIVALEDAIGSYACSLEANIEANMRVTNGIPLGSTLLLPLPS